MSHDNGEYQVLALSQLCLTGNNNIVLPGLAMADNLAVTILNRVHLRPNP